jgi:putative NIF3 family GTP cyclohydrolase 1 type 2
MDAKTLYTIFDPNLLDALPDEWGVVIHDPAPQSLGYATTLTPDVIQQAAQQGIHLLVTHHDAWEFMREERTACLELLEQHQISHVWCHAPLDRADFGMAASLLELAGCRIVAKIVEEGGRVGALPEATPLSAIRGLLDEQLNESPCRTNDAGRLIKRIGCVPGAGANTGYLAEALAYEVDLYLTGETSLYLLEYARFHNVSVLVYSHNYTEIFGTRNLADRLAAQLGINTVTRLEEPHF